MHASASLYPGRSTRGGFWALRYVRAWMHDDAHARDICSKRERGYLSAYIDTILGRETQGLVK